MTLTVTLPSGGSSFGLSMAKSQVNCGRAAFLSAAAKLDPESDLDGYTGKGPAIGTCFHALQELYGNRTLLSPAQLDNVTWGPEKHSCLSDAEYPSEATRLMRWWMGEFQPNYFGKVLGSEMPIPQNDEAWARLQAEFGNKARTARMDKLVQMDAADSDRVNERFGVDTSPGTLLVDWKVLGKRGGYEGYVNDLQALYYPQAFQICYPDQDVKGILFVFIIRNKAPVVEAIFVPPPNKTERRIVQHFLNYEHDHRTLLPNRANASACFEYNKPCFWLRSGKCDRTDGKE